MARSKPEERSDEVPAYMTSFGDMITLLLTFFILLVALADTQTAGLVGAGLGPLIRHVNAKGEPGILPGRLIEYRELYKRDSWWIPDQEGDPDELEVVRRKLDRELVTKFKPDEASLRYEQDRLVLRLPARIEYDARGRPMVSEATRDVLRLVARSAYRRPDRFIRINGDVTDLGSPREAWLASARLCQLVYVNLTWNGMNPRRISMWGWGAGRAITGDPVTDRGVTIEVLDVPVVTDGAGYLEGE